MENNIYILIILYNPNQTQIDRIKELATHHKLIVIDNSDDNKNDIFNDSEHILYIPLLSNKGIATAQNIGIAKAKELKAEYVIFFDQDSNIPEDYTSCMLKEYLCLKEQNKNIATLGPVVINEVEGIEYKAYDVSNRFYKVDSIISSGSIVELSILDQVGVMEDALFIDLVDLEWCWRAKSFGLDTYITTSVKLPHSIGNACVKFMGVSLLQSKPFRYFYQYRNIMFMMRRNYVPTKWKIKISIKMFMNLIYQIFKFNCYAEKRMVLSNMMNGLKASFEK